jgi:shikimate kinase
MSVSIRRLQLVLTGMMGTGKTTVGRVLADQLDWTFIDLDAEVERRLGVSVAEIFANLGEAEFRRLEHETLKSALSRPAGAVVALGGGAILQAMNQRLLEPHLVVWLDADPEQIWQRVQEEGRPLLVGRSRQDLEHLIEQRRPCYAQYSRWRLDTSAISPVEAAQRIVEWLNQSEGRHANGQGRIY